MDRQARKKAAGRGREWMVAKRFVLYRFKSETRPATEKEILDDWARVNNPLHRKKTRLGGKEKRG